jgi:hypothetical protein
MVTVPFVLMIQLVLPMLAAAHFAPDAATNAKDYRAETLGALGCAPPSVRGAVPAAWARNFSHADLLFGDGPLGDDTANAAVGNGYLAWRAGSSSLFLAGVYDGPSQSANPSHAAKFPALFNFSVSTTDLSGGATLRDVGTALDLRGARVVTQRTLADSVVDQVWFAHRAFRSLMVHRTTVTGGGPGALAALTIGAANAAPGSFDFDFYDAAKVRCPAGATCLVGVTKEPETWDTPRVTVAYVGTAAPPEGTFIDPSGEFFAVGAARSTLDSSDPLAAATADYLNATARGFADLEASHMDAWAALRSEGGIDVDCLSLAQAVNASAYYILMSARADWPHSLSPQALSEGEGNDPSTYHHHIFWDCETWQLPHLTVFHPALSTSVLQYRFDRRAGAREKARSYTGMGWTGTMFPWESASTGIETCPTWAITGLLEQHITADIGVAVWQAWRAHRDLDWLRTVGFPLLEGIADFWASRVVRGGRSNRDGLSGNGSSSELHIPFVIPPDEYAINVTDSVYTNAAAALSLRAAAAAGAILSARVDPRWTETADGLVILYNRTLGIHPEFAGYAGQLIKQADVILLGFPLMVPGMPDGSRARDLVYYSNRTDPNGPAMTWGMVAVGLLELSALSDNS